MVPKQTMFTGTVVQQLLTTPGVMVGMLLLIMVIVCTSKIALLYLVETVLNGRAISLVSSVTS
jgi:hypothetical protein